jgi:hypothetical protein
MERQDRQRANDYRLNAFEADLVVFRPQLRYCR